MREFNFALAGNANVGKSVIFNQLTGLDQTIGNWPGKTVEKAEGTFFHANCSMRIIDLPGIYSLSTYSIEEIVSRDYISKEKPDVVINVVDASHLERNLFFTTQLLELGRPVVVALNQIDMAEKNGIKINVKKLSKELGVPVVPLIAVRGTGIHELVDASIKAAKRAKTAMPLKFGKEIDERIRKLLPIIKNKDYSKRFLASKLLEKDENIEKEVNNEAVKKAKALRKEIEKIHGEDAHTILSSERYAIASRIARECEKVYERKRSITDFLDRVTTRSLTGYPILAITFFMIFSAIFTLGDIMIAATEELLDSVGYSALEGTIFSGLADGIVSIFTIVVPYLIPFFIILAILQDSGYLARVAFLMDSLMHKIGLHGKAFIPLVLGYGCTVPACMGCRIMETYRERFLAAFATTLIPCAARTVIILGLVGAYVGIEWALFLYAFNLFVVFILGRVAYKILPGEGTGLIMEMPPYRVPNIKTIINQSWARIKDYAVIAVPYIIGGSIAIQIMNDSGILPIIIDLLSPVTVLWLGLPAVCGVSLIFGVVRKELALVLLGTLFGTTNFASVLTPVQMIVFTLVSMFYVPCVATMGALKREFGTKKMLYISIFEVTFAIILGGIASRVLPMLI